MHTDRRLMNTMKAVVILGILLAPYLLMHVNAQQEVKVEIANGSKKVDNDRFYVPATITIPVGTTVVWTNLDDARHTVTDGTPKSKWGVVFDSGIMCPAKADKDNPCRQGSVFKFTFNKVGEFPYLCALHPWMYGKIIVVPEGGKIPVEISLATDKTAYNAGDNVEVNGSVSPVGSEQQVTIEVLNSDHTQIRADKISVNKDGVFNYGIKLEGVLAQPGSYTIKVTYSDTSKENTFTVGKSEQSTEKPKASPGNITPSNKEKSSTSVRVLSKQLKNFLLIRVSNAQDSSADIYGLSFQVAGSDIKAFKGPKDWSKPKALSGEVKSSTQDEPIKPGDKMVFQIKVDVGQIVVIHWIAYDSSDSVLAQGDAKPISNK